MMFAFLPDVLKKKKMQLICVLRGEFLTRFCCLISLLMLDCHPAFATDNSTVPVHGLMRSPQGSQNHQDAKIMCTVFWNPNCL